MGRDHLSIGEVLALIKGDFPDVTVSKIRFLEGQGLLEPERTPSGYRKFSDHDLERLRWILVQQRDHFLPLKVIKARLDGEEVLRTSTHGDQIELPLGDLAPLIDPPPPAAPPADPDLDQADLDQADLDQADADELEAQESIAAPSYAASSATLTAQRVTSNAAPTQAGGGTPDDARDPGAWLEDLAAGRTKQPAAPAELGAQHVASGSTAGPPADIDLVATDVLPTQDDRDAQGDGGDAPPLVSLESTDEQFPDEVSQHVDAGALQSDPASPAETSSEDHVLADTASPGGIAMDTAPDGEPRETDAAEVNVDAASDPVVSLDESDPDITWLDLDRDDVALTRAELAEVSGLSEPALADLEHFGLISTRRSGPVEVYGQPSLQVAMQAKAFYDKGLEARHLRMFIVSAEREAAFLQNVVSPLLHRRNDGGKVEAVEILDELGLAGLHLRDALLRGILETYLSDG